MTQPSLSGRHRGSQVSLSAPYVRLHRRQIPHYVWPKIGWIYKENPYIPTVMGHSALANLPCNTTHNAHPYHTGAQSCSPGGGLGDQPCWPGYADIKATGECPVPSGIGRDTGPEEAPASESQPHTASTGQRRAPSLGSTTSSGETLSWLVLERGIEMTG